MPVTINPLSCRVCPFTTKFKNHPFGWFSNLPSTGIEPVTFPMSRKPVQYCITKSKFEISALKNEIIGVRGLFRGPIGAVIDVSL